MAARKDAPIVQIEAGVFAPEGTKVEFEPVPQDTAAVDAAE